MANSTAFKVKKGGPRPVIAVGTPFPAFAPPVQPTLPPQQAPAASVGAKQPTDPSLRGTINGQWAPNDPAWDGYPPDNTVTGTATRKWVPGQGWVPSMAGGGSGSAGDDPKQGRLDPDFGAGLHDQLNALYEIIRNGNAANDSTGPGDADHFNLPNYKPGMQNGGDTLNPRFIGPDGKDKYVHSGGPVSMANGGRGMAGKPVVNAPEPASLIGDRTGKVYARVGDSPKGPETFQVTPPAGPAPAPVRVGPVGPASMAGGGSGSAGGDMQAEAAKWAKTGFPGAEPLSSPEYQAFVAKYGPAGVAAFHQMWAAQRGVQWRDTPGIVQPVSMASGGFGVAGGSNVDPYDQQQAQQRVNDAQTAVGQNSNLITAGNNVNDINNVAMTRTLQADQNQRYGELGVPVQQSVTLQPGTTTPNDLGQFAQNNTQTNQQQLQAGYNQQNRTTSLNENLSAAQHAASMLQQGGSSGSGGGGSGVPRSSGGGGQLGGVAELIRHANDSAQPPDAPFMQEYTDPFSGIKQLLSPAEMAVQKAKDQKQISDQAQDATVPGAAMERATAEKQRLRAAQDEAAKLQGLVPTDMPDGSHQYLTPQQAAAQKEVADRAKKVNDAIFSAQLKQQIAKLNPSGDPFQGPSDDKLIQGLVAAQKQPKSFSPEDLDKIRKSLKARNWSDGAIDVAVQIAEATAKNGPSLATGDAFGSSAGGGGVDEGASLEDHLGGVRVGS